MTHVRGYINKKSAERVSNKHTGNPDTENGTKGQEWNMDMQGCGFPC